MGVTVNDPRRDIAADTRQKGRQQTRARAVATRRKTQQNETEERVGGEMHNIGMQQRGREQPPPFAGREGRSVQDSGLAETGPRDAQPIEDHGQQPPRRC